MKGLRRMIPMAVVIAALATFAPVSALQSLLRLDSPGEATADQWSVGDISHVANVPHPNNQRGSDLEFVTKRVVKLSNGATGSPVCVEDTTQPDGCARDESGAIVYQMEDRDFALAGTYGNGQIVDVTNPRTPVRVATMPCNVTQNDIQVWGNLMFQAHDAANGSCRRPDGTNQGSVSVGISDISDPRNPRFVGRITYGRGAHNHTVHPTEPLIYISDSDLAHTGLGEITIWDFSNPAAPTQVTPVFKHLVHSPHDITFNADGSRAYAAAVSTTYILNTEDPRNPSVISTIANEGISISHQADPTPDGRFLLVSDELGGGAAGVSPGGGVHVYDILNELTPVKIGDLMNDCLPEMCQSALTDGVPVSTAHVFRINPDGYTMAIGWYKDGMGVIDFSDVFGTNAAGSGSATGAFGRVIAWMKMPGANTWTAKMWQERHPGYVFANDARGLDVFYVPELDNGFIGTGVIRGGHPGTTVLGGVTENEWAVVNGCDGRPNTQGLDGYVFEDVDAGDGNHRIFLKTTHGPAADLTVWFYNGSCSLMSDNPAVSGDPIPEGAEHIVVAGFTGAQVRFMAYAR